MPANYHKYECADQHVTLLLIPTPITPSSFECPICPLQSHYQGDILVKGLSQVAHGTYSAYAHGCRCDSCREANRLHMQDRRASVKNPTNVATSYRDRAHQDLVNYIEHR